MEQKEQSRRTCTDREQKDMEQKDMHSTRDLNHRGT